MKKLPLKSKKWFFLHGLVENLILGKNQEKKFRKFRGSGFMDVPVLPGALFFEKNFFHLFQLGMAAFIYFPLLKHFI